MLVDAERRLMYTFGVGWRVAVLKTRPFIARAVALRIERSDAPMKNAILNEFVSLSCSLARLLARSLARARALSPSKSEKVADENEIFVFRVQGLGFRF